MMKVYIFGIARLQVAIHLSPILLFISYQYPFDRYIGRQYDKNGDLLNWWGNSTEINFLERAQCIIDQYGNYTEPKTNLSVSGFE